MITYTGERVYPDHGVPSPYSVAVGLSRIPRFCGQTRVVYPVLSHVFVVAALLPPKWVIHGLVHDAAEACCADVPTTWKTEAARERESCLMDRIYEGWQITPLTEEAEIALKQADLAALAAEAHALGHSEASLHWPQYDAKTYSFTMDQLENHTGRTPEEAARDYMAALSDAKRLMFPRIEVEV